MSHPSSDILPNEMSQFKSLIEDFNTIQIGRLAERTAAGYSGWDCPEFYGLMRAKLGANAMSGDWVDVANLAMFLWYQEKFLHDELDDSDS